MVPSYGRKMTFVGCVTQTANALKLLSPLENLLGVGIDNVGIVIR